MFALAPLFGWVWGRVCLISKTLHGLEYLRKWSVAREEEKNKYKTSLESIQCVILPSSIISIAIPCLKFFYHKFLDLLIGVCIIKKRWIIIDPVISLWKCCEGWWINSLRIVGSLACIHLLKEKLIKSVKLFF